MSAPFIIRGERKYMNVCAFLIRCPAFFIEKFLEVYAERSRREHRLVRKTKNLDLNFVDIFQISCKTFSRYNI